MQAEMTEQKKERRAMPKGLKKWVKRLLAIALVLVVLTALGSQKGGKDAVLDNYLVATAEYRDLTVKVSGTGTLEPNDAAAVTSVVMEDVLEANFEEGDTVTKGQLLYRLDDTSARIAVEQAEIAVQQAKLSYGDAAELKTQGAGVVEQLYVKQGDTVTAGMLVAEIADRETVRLKVPFLSQDAKNITVGQAASVQVNGYADVLTGRVTEVSAADLTDAGGALVRKVEVELKNPGAITDTMQGSVTVGGASGSATGTFSYASSSQIVAKAGGIVTSLQVQEGSRVSAQQVIGTLGQTSTAENANLGVQQAELSYQSASNSLDNYYLTAPISGTVIEKNFEAGEVLDSSTLSAHGGYLALIYDLSALKFSTSIDELDINKIAVGQKVLISSDSVEGETFTGKVTKINVHGTTVNGRTTYPVTITVDGVPSALLPGMNVSAEILVEEAGNVLCVPVDAVQRGNTVQIPGEGALNETQTGVIDSTKLEDKTVTLGRNDSEYIEIVDGLAEGDTVVIRNQTSSMMQLMMGG